VSLELEAGGLNRVAGFDSAVREYNVWFDVAGAGPGPVAFCADGSTPSTVLSSDPAVDTYIEILASSFFIDYACSPGVASADGMSVDPIDPTVDCITFPFAP
jgi:hypothetical protein